MPKGSMNFEEMAALVKKATERYDSLQSDALVNKRTGYITLRWEGAEEHWVQIELGIEAFFFEVDRGYQAVACEYDAPGQSELLEEFVDAAYKYLTGRFAVSSRRSLLGRKLEIVTIEVDQGEQLELKRMRQPRS